MIEGLKTLIINEPALFTTSVVLSHIDNITVINFLNLLNNTPLGSTLYFFEPYDKNKHQYLWYVRNKEWWAKHLPNWQLTFHDYGDNNDKSGISGKCVGKDKVTEKYQNNIWQKITWFLSGIPSYIKYIIRIFLNLFE